MSIRRIVPAILTDDPKALQRMVRQAEQFISWAQFDIMDGLFVPPQSISPSDIVAAKPDFEFDAHLMVRHPESMFEAFGIAGARRITFHGEAVADAAFWVPYIKHLGLEAGLALNPETEWRAVTPALAQQLDIVLLLSVQPGYYGRPFLPEVLDKAKKLHEAYPELLLGMDGGIKAANIRDIARAGVDEICVGSAIFSADEPAAAQRHLLSLAEEGWQEYCSKS